MIDPGRIRIPASPSLTRLLQPAIFIVGSLFYSLTASRTPGWMDATLVLSMVRKLDLGTWVDTHNLFNLLGFLWLKAWPRQDAHFMLAILAGLFGALTISFIFRAVVELTGEVISACFAALVLMVSHSLWWHSTMVNVKTLDSAILAIMVFFIFRYDRTGKPAWLFAASFCLGLGCVNHVLMGLFVFAFLALVIYRIVRPRPHSGRHIGIAVLCALLGGAFYLYLFVCDVRDAMIVTGSGDVRAWMRNVWQAFLPTFDDATGGKFKQLMFATNLPAGVARFWRINYAFLLGYNFPSPALAMAFYGLWVFWKKPAFRLSLVFFLIALLAQAVWSANYFVWDMYAFAQCVYVLLGIPIGLAAERLLRSPPALRGAFLVLILPMLVLPGVIYARMPSWYRNGGIMQRFFDSYPDISLTAHTWDPVEFITNPDKRGYDKVKRYAEAFFAIVPQGTHFLSADSRADYPLRYYYRDYLHVRTDIQYHSIWSPALTEDGARDVALALRACLDEGAPVYAASIQNPERPVLDQLFLLAAPARSLESIQALSTDEYVRQFPGVELRKIVFSEAEQVWIYRLVLRAR